MRNNTPIVLKPLTFEYTVRNEISTIDFESDRTGSWEDFEYFWSKERAKYNFNLTSEEPHLPEQETFHIQDARKLIYDYFFKEDKFFMWHRTPHHDVHGFSADQNHTAQYLVAKAVKDTMI